MTPKFDRDLERLEQIVRLIAHIQRRVAHMTVDQFGDDQDEIDLTAFRLAAIGEATNGLSDGLKARYPRIPWRAIYAMRNIVSHDYAAIIPQRVWITATTELESLKTVCRIELMRITAQR